MNRQQRRRAARTAAKRGKPAGPAPRPSGDDPRMDAARAVHKAGRLDEAEALYDQLLTENPQDPGALHFKGVLAFQRGRVADALALMEDAIRLRPGVPVFYENLGNVHMMAGDRTAAEAAYREALRLDSSLAGCHARLATLLFVQGRIEEAGTAARKAIELDPRATDALTTLSAVLRQQGDLPGAKAAVHRALEIDPDHEPAHSSLIFLHDFDPTMSFADQQAERRRWAARFADPLTAQRKPHANTPDPERRLRVGYVSGDFRGHSAATTFGPLIFERDRAAFEAVCYSTSAISDNVTKKFRDAADLWRPCWGLSDEDFADMVRADGIDILVDLAGHTMGNRLAAFGRKPAPVQVTGWGHCTGTGVAAVDYIFADAVMIPPEDARYCAETVVELSSALTLMPPAAAPAVGPVPSVAAGHVTFGCFNRIEKVSDEALTAWASLLAELPDARLRLKTVTLDDAGMVAHLTQRLIAAGIDPDRVDLLGGTRWSHHMETYNSIDIALDPFPQSGGVTSIEALWMGVPVVSLRGGTPASRVTNSIVTAAGHPEWIGRTVDDYVAIAARLAADPAARAALRANLRPALQQIPLGNPRLYVREVEANFRRIWRRWCETQGIVATGSPPPLEVQALFQEAIGHHGAGRLDAALALYDRILAAAPDNPDALHLKGVALAQGGRADDGVALVRAAIARRDDNVDYHNNLGNLLWQAGRLDEAETALRRAIAVAPGHAAAHNNLGNVLDEAGRAEAAMECYRRAAELEPGNSAFQGNLGIALQKAGRLDEAEAALRRAVTLAPGSPEAHNNLGNVLQTIGDLEAAEAELRQAVALRPDYANAFYNLGSLLMERRAVREAVEVLQRAVALSPGLASAWSNLAAGFNLLERHDDGAAAARKAIDLVPTLSEAWNNLGVALRALGYNAEAEDAYRRVVTLNPKHSVAHSNLIFVLDFDPRYGVAEHQAERRRWNERHAAPLAGEIRPHVNDADPGRRLRIGYVSADFRQHSAANCFGPMIRDHDRDAFDVVCYSSNFRDDAVTARFREAATEWRDCFGMADARLAETIRADGIDILVDLSGHTAGNRLLAFARKPAPVQVTAWGHGVGTGLDAMDYFLTDPVIVPDAEAGLYAERIRYLPSHIPYLPPVDAPPVAPPPVAATGRFTFGSFNRLEKVNDEVLGLWRDILARLPDSRLLIKSQALDRATVLADFERRLDALGFDRSRLELFGSTPQPEHLALHGRVDLTLDTFPHSGGVTSGDSLWMGVPVVTWRGGTVPWRLAASTLHALSLDRFVAATAEQYVELAVALAGETDLLAELRRSLRDRMAASPVGDAVRYCRAVEAVYREIWRDWCGTRRG